MKRKSKFLVFILSPIPGLSHLYLGWQQRALVYFMAFLGICVGGVAIEAGSMGAGGIMSPLIFFAAAIVWFSALAEALRLAGIMNSASGLPEAVDREGQDAFFISNRKLMALSFSVIPGAGHMFLGLFKEGAGIMAAFFFVVMAGGWLNFSLLDFLAPVIWFYSLFDIYHKLEEEEELELEGFNLVDWFSTHPQWVGWGLIILGSLVILKRLLVPFAHWLNPNISSFINNSFIALLLIAGGIKLLLGSKVKTEEGDAQ